MNSEGIKLKNTKGWIVTAAATGINLILGVLYIWSIMSKALIKEFEWTNTQASLPYTVCIASFALVMIFAGRLQDLKGPKIGAALGGILLGSGLILSGVVKDPFLMMLAYGLMGGAGIGFCYAATTPPAVKWFSLEKKGLISGIVVSGVGFAAVYISPLTQMLIKKNGVSQTFIIIGIGALVIILILSQFLVNPQAEYTIKINKPLSKTTKLNNKVDYAWKEMLKTLGFYKLWVMYAFAASAGLMIIGHITSIAKQQAGWENGYYLVVLLAVFNTLGRIMGGLLSDKFGYVKTMRTVFLIQAVNMLLFSQYGSPGFLALGVSWTGLTYGALFSLFPAAIAQHYGTKNLGVNYGLLFTSWGLAGVIGPLLAGKILDSTSTYQISYSISAILLVLASVLTFVNNHTPIKTHVETVAKLTK